MSRGSSYSDVRRYVIDNYDNAIKNILGEAPLKKYEIYYEYFGDHTLINNRLEITLTERIPSAGTKHTMTLNIKQNDTDNNGPARINLEFSKDKKSYNINVPPPYKKVLTDNINNEKNLKILNTIIKAANAKFSGSTNAPVAVAPSPAASGSIVAARAAMFGGPTPPSLVANSRPVVSGSIAARAAMFGPSVASSKPTNVRPSPVAVASPKPTNVRPPPSPSPASAVAPTNMSPSTAEEQEDTVPQLIEKHVAVNVEVDVTDNVIVPNHLAVEPKSPESIFNILGMVITKNYEMTGFKYNIDRTPTFPITDNSIRKNSVEIALTKVGDENSTIMITIANTGITIDQQGSGHTEFIKELKNMTEKNSGKLKNILNEANVKCKKIAEKYNKEYTDLLAEYEEEQRSAMGGRRSRRKSHKKSRKNRKSHKKSRRSNRSQRRQ